MNLTGMRHEETAIAFLCPLEATELGDVTMTSNNRNLNYKRSLELSRIIDLGATDFILKVPFRP